MGPPGGMKASGGHHGASTTTTTMLPCLTCLTQTPMEAMYHRRPVTATFHQPHITTTTTTSSSVISRTSSVLAGVPVGRFSVVVPNCFRNRRDRGSITRVCQQSISEGTRGRNGVKHL